MNLKTLYCYEFQIRIYKEVDKRKEIKQMDFCESELWNSNLTWYTDTPQFTECFQSTVLVYTPAGVLVVTSIMDIYNYIHSRLRTIPWSVCLITYAVALSQLTWLRLEVRRSPLWASSARKREKGTVAISARGTGCVQAMADDVQIWFAPIQCTLT